MADPRGARERRDGASPEELEQEVARLRSILLQSGKLAELGTRVAALVHEMNQPLVAIKAFSQMIKATSTDEEASRRAGLIEQQAEVLVSLINSIRIHARQGESEHAADLGEAIPRAVELVGHLFRRVRVDLEVDVAASPLIVPLGEVHLQQLLVNLLTNALDAVEDSSRRRVRLSAGTTSDGVLLRVEDSGSGIPPEVASKVLEPFFTTKDPERGTGLGLPICQEIVGSCGGTLDIGDAATEGFRTIVEVRLPAAARSNRGRAV